MPWLSVEDVMRERKSGGDQGVAFFLDSGTVNRHSSPIFTGPNDKDDSCDPVETTNKIQKDLFEVSRTVRG